MSLNEFIRLHLDLVNLTNNEKKCRECLNKECKKKLVLILNIIQIFLLKMILYIICIDHI
jgi:hypothetical protein